MKREIGSILEEVAESDGLYLGQWRRPVNSAIHVVGSIHDDDMASRLGFRGGTVAGSIHLEMFPPLMLKAFGERWFEKGNVSMYFLDPTVDREEVRAVVAVPPSGRDVQVEIWAERPDGRRIGEGTAAVGEGDAVSALSARDLSRYPPGELRILARAAAGDAFPEVEFTVSREMVDRRLEFITDPLPWYEGESPWGGSIATPSNLVDLLRFAADSWLHDMRGSDVVALYGAIELRNVNGPVLVDKPYVCGGRVLSLGQSPKTEYIWFDGYAAEAGGKHVAEMRMMYRFMKDSSPLYQSAKP